MDDAAPADVALGCHGEPDRGAEDPRDHRPDLRGTVLLLEDSAERPHRVDRMLTQLRLARALDSLAAVVLGEFTGCGSVVDILAERLLDLGLPILTGLPVVPLGARVTVDTSEGSLRFLEGAVAAHPRVAPLRANEDPSAAGLGRGPPVRG